MTSDARIEAIKKRAEKATKAEPLPWKASYTNGDGLWGIKMGGDNEIITGIDANGNSDVTTFLAHSPTDIEYLLSKLDAAERVFSTLDHFMLFHVSEEDGNKYGVGSKRHLEKLFDSFQAFSLLKEQYDAYLTFRAAGKEQA